VRARRQLDGDRVAGADGSALPDHAHDPGLEDEVPRRRVEFEDLLENAFLNP
jgi:hypothetical protein